MVDFDDGLDTGEDALGNASSKVNKKKLLLIILPVLIIIGLVVSFYAVFKSSEKNEVKNYHVVSSAAETKDGPNKTTIFYDLPEITAVLQSRDDTHQTVKLQISFEITGLSEDKISIVDGLSPKISDIIISHLVEVYPDEIESSEGLYWLKEELLYRTNLITHPIKINNINFKNFEIQKDTQ